MKKEMKHIPAMTPSEIHEYLFRVGSEWGGQGVAMELGCWLGATSVPLLCGLVQAGYDRPFWAFDRWWADEAQVGKAHAQGVELRRGENSVGKYLDNVKSVYDDVRTVRGELPGSLTGFIPEAIEVVVFDAPKKDPMFKNSMNYLLPRFIPGRTVVALLDYYMYEKADGKRRERLQAPVRFMERYADNFELIKDWKGLCSCAVFKYTKLIDRI